MELSIEQVIKMVEDITETKQLVKDILVQTTKTNGQVRANTSWISEHQGMHNAFLIIAGLFGGAVGAIFTGLATYIIYKVLGV